MMFASKVRGTGLKLLEEFLGTSSGQYGGHTWWNEANTGIRSIQCTLHATNSSASQDKTRFIIFMVWPHEYEVICSRAALDLQSCGITTDGASHFQEVLRLNTTLIILDLRANALLGMDSNSGSHSKCIYLKVEPCPWSPPPTFFA